ncbi:hypothetical protein [Robertkochia sediminum]|uniref:hypothetical protein n=1 Tax=Robertkochia sediminum TaxID=2785326 RepID=UPI00193259DA|nr:hypothetical protein [Robertkochia sediminum]MBL7472183.1 hypothetical protein [Robertkochia sediminum]
MTIDHLEERVKDYTISLEKVLLKKKEWQTKSRPSILRTLEEIHSRFPIGWAVQQFNWMWYNEAVNITFKSLPETLQDLAVESGDGELIKGGALVFSQLHNGDISVIVLFPFADPVAADSGSLDLGTYRPDQITEKLVIEKVDEFLKEMIRWEAPTPRDKIGFVS